MSVTPRPDTPAEQALAYLHTAANRAETLAHGDIFSAWGALADQIRLVAGAIDPAADSTLNPSADSVHDCLTLALDTLDSAPAEPELLVWIWHVIELRRLADQLTTGQ